MEEYIRTTLKDGFIKKLFEFDKEDISNIIPSIEKYFENEKISDGTWMLCANNDEEKDNYIVLQVASSKDISGEIILDLKLMLPCTEKDIKDWSSYFYKNLFKMDYSQSKQCQKYNDIYKKYNHFAVAIIDYEKVFSILERKFKDLIIGFEEKRKECVEVYLACQYKAVYWNPNHFNGECAILKKCKKDWMGTIN